MISCTGDVRGTGHASSDIFSSYSPSIIPSTPSCERVCVELYASQGGAPFDRHSTCTWRYFFPDSNATIGYKPTVMMRRSEPAASATTGSCLHAMSRSAALHLPADG